MFLELTGLCGLVFAEHTSGNIALILQMRALSPKRFGELPMITQAAAKLSGEPAPLMFKLGPLLTCHTASLLLTLPLSSRREQSKGEPSGISGTEAPSSKALYD